MRRMFQMTLRLDPFNRYWSPCAKCCVCYDVFSNWTCETYYHAET